MSTSFQRRSATASAKRVRLAQGTSDVSLTTATTTQQEFAPFPRQVIQQGQGQFFPNSTIFDNYSSTESVILQPGVVHNNIYHRVEVYEIRRFNMATMTELDPIRIPSEAAWYDNDGYFSQGLLGGRFLVTLPLGSYDSEDTFLIPVYDLQLAAFADPITLTLPAHSAWSNRAFGSLCAFDGNTLVATPNGYFSAALKLAFDGTSISATLMPIDTAILEASGEVYFDCSRFCRYGATSKMVALDMDGSSEMRGAAIVVDVDAETAQFALGGGHTVYSRTGTQLATSSVAPGELLRVLQRNAEQDAIGGYVTEYDLVWNMSYVPSLSALVSVPFDDHFVTVLRMDEEEGTFHSHRYHLNWPEFHREEKWGSAVYNARRDALVLIPAESNNVVEMKWTGTQFRVSRYMVLNGAYQFAFCDGLLIGRNIWAFPMGAAGTGILKIPTTMDPTQPIHSLY
jgi:hypothetical protein